MPRVISTRIYLERKVEKAQTRGLSHIDSKDRTVPEHASRTTRTSPSLRPSSKRSGARRAAAGLPPLGAEAGELPWPIAQGSASEPRLPDAGAPCRKEALGAGVGACTLNDTAAADFAPRRAGAVGRQQSGGPGFHRFRRTGFPSGLCSPRRRASVPLAGSLAD